MFDVGKQGLLVEAGVIPNLYGIGNGKHQHEAQDHSENRGDKRIRVFHKSS